ncbi:MAG TPA: beta-propeller fold lactonase family protein [Longimicrobiaceae bacterium]
MKKWIGAAAGVLALAACSSNPVDGRTDDLPRLAVFAMTNQASNAVVMFPRGLSGTLGAGQSYSTRGGGTNASLGSQGALAVTGDGAWVLAANAGSNDVTVFRVHRDSLEFIARTASGGTKPVSIAVRGTLVYVLNAGGAGNVTGFQLTTTGLSPLAGTTKPLSGAADPQPAQVGFSPDGTRLIVTEKATNKIDVYTVNANGTLTGPVVSNSSGVTPFGFAFSPVSGLLLVSNANAPGGTPVPDASSVTQYSLDAGNNLTVAAGPLGTTETAACWVVITPDGRLAFVSNTGSASITAFRLNVGLTLITPDGKTATTGPANAMPVELALTPDGQTLYVLNTGIGSIRGYRVSSTGTLTQVTEVTGLPVNSYGLVAN